VKVWHVRRRRWRTDEELLGNTAVMVLLAAVAAGRVVRGEGGETSTWAPHMLGRFGKNGDFKS
jgi:hypothetical protein